MSAVLVSLPIRLQRLGLDSGADDEQHGSIVSLDCDPAGTGLMLTVRFSATKAEQRTTSGAILSQNS